MREILFRGKRIYNGEWVEGYYFYRRGRYKGEKTFVFEKHYITTGIEETSGAYGECVERLEWEVLPESVSEFTGLCDKNGNKIFDGAILEITREYYNRKEKSLYKVRYHEATASFCAFAIDFLQRVPLCQKECKYYEIIGNIHDNPELLKEGDE
jgi:hypothetical protein